MGILDKLFARQREEPGETTPPSTARLTREQAIDDMLDWLGSAPDPDLVLQKLGYGRACLRALESDDEISGALETRQDALITTPWRLEPGEGPVAEAVKEELAPWFEQVMSSAWHALPYGYSVQEVVWRPEPGNRQRVAGVDAIVEKPFEWFTVYRDGSLRYLRPGAGIEGMRVDTAYKFLLTRHRASYRNPHGEALLSRLYWPWFFRQQGWQFWMTFLERHGQPLLLGKGAQPEQLAKALADAVQDSVVAVGQNDTVDSISSQSSGESFDRMEEALVRRIQKRILGQTLTSGTDGGSGNRALGEVHDRVRHDRRDADIRLVAPTVQRLIDAFVYLRFGPSAEAPTFMLEDGKGLQPQRAERDTKLHTVGVRFTPEYVARTYGLEDDEFTIADEAQGGGGGSLFSAGRDMLDTGALERSYRGIDPRGRMATVTGDGRGHPLPATVEEFDRTPDDRFTEDQQDVENMVEGALPQTPSPIDPEELRNIIRASEGPEDLQQRLAETFTAQRLGDRRQFRVMLERAMFAADLMGYGYASGDADAEE